MIRNRRFKGGEIPTGSMADIAFLLLVFFLVTTTIDTDKGLGIVLPPAGDVEIEIKKKNIKFLCLAGFMKVLSNNFIKSFRYKIVNIHPSLLPKYKGLDAHKRVLKNNEKYSGCTVHYVVPELDSGKIILQKRVLIDRNETTDSLKSKILKQEHVLYPKSIISIFK